MICSYPFEFILGFNDNIILVVDDVLVDSEITMVTMAICCPNLSKVLTAVECVSTFIRKSVLEYI
jgi:hypothetical protein